MFSKDRTKVFMFACIGVLALTVAYQLGSRPALAQSGGTCVALHAGITGGLLVLTSTGDIYEYRNTGPSGWVYVNNVFGPVPASSTSWGQVKGQNK